MSSAVDLVGRPFAVLESDPGSFTILLRKLGLQHLEVTEIYSIEPWATAHLEHEIRALIFCYPCPADSQRDSSASAVNFEEELADPDAEDVWFAYQLSVDACASQTILNVCLNMEDVSFSAQLRDFHNNTLKMDPLMRGLSFTDCSFIRDAHNSMARPVDIRAAEHALARTTLEYAKTLKARPEGYPAKRRKLGTPKKSQTKQSASDSQEREDTFHYIGYVPTHGHVWELDGLRTNGPLDVGELPQASGRQGWMDIVRPALQRKMHSVQGVADGRYNLLAIIDDRYEKASDALEMLKRERNALERRLDEANPDGWKDKADKELVEKADKVFETSLQSSAPGQTFVRDFGARKMELVMRVLDMPERNLDTAWGSCVRSAIEGKRAVEEEVTSAKRANTENISRTHDYEDFLRTFVGYMHRERLLDAALSSKKA
ncbi:uncharacterized protein PHACADRAFT_177948 [Phanerochaete carnosa HHB-10118-sp]|uniref:ubiquitinyl hydrolase 1 n=1 Tax=Phanerochaete carnosa (strain HHB-10118-sp) TaxID=650164 RepID=K5WM14_PHACS|nr:uncharacterized protein PHACADRAFT_177948 [Phanerochaete carnosa HHB-10118-sp]EKM51297.1 hypothetical protein PHACADRAFT_177948 [Phanerochaete carnosa HHB-10118-sp]